MARVRTNADMDLLPVVLGGDIGVYAIARQLHEATGARVTVVAPGPITAITRSGYIDVVHQPEDADDRAVIDLLRSLVTGRAPRSAVLMANTDAGAEFLARHRAELEPTYVVPFPDADVIAHVSDKAAFAQVCAQVGVRTPRQVVVDLADPAPDPDQGPDTGAPDWQPPVIDLDFPVVAKAAVGSAYDAISFPGKRKIWFPDSPAELDALWTTLRRAGYTSTFVVQERIGGDDSAMRSVTAYVDSTGAVRLIGSARVLLEDHAPTMIGNPVAMITEPYPDLWVATERILTAVGYRGFANLDIKIDPRDGDPVFFEVNPRIGRNSFYMTAAGANPLATMIDDLVDDRRGPRREVTREVLYSLVPLRLLLRYLDDAALRERVRHLARRGAADPLRDPAERSPLRRAVVEAQRLNHYRKYARHHPATGRGHR